MRYLLFLFLLGAAPLTFAQQPNTAAGVDAHHRRLLAEARRMDRAARAKAVPPDLRLEHARSVEEYRRDERRLRKLVGHALGIATYFEMQHKYLDILATQRRENQKLLDDLMVQLGLVKQNYVSPSTRGTP